MGQTPPNQGPPYGTRWHTDGYVELSVAERQETVRAEPFDAIELRLAVLFGDDDDE